MTQVKLNNKVILPDRNNINKLCRLTSCEHGDITSIDVGRIVGIIEDGYSIEYTKKFKAGPHKFEDQTNIIYGDPKYIIIL